MSLLDLPVHVLCSILTAPALADSPLDIVRFGLTCTRACRIAGDEQLVWKPLCARPGSPWARADPGAWNASSYKHLHLAMAWPCSALLGDWTAPDVFPNGRLLRVEARAPQVVGLSLYYRSLNGPPCCHAVFTVALPPRGGAPPQRAVVSCLKRSQQLQHQAGDGIGDASHPASLLLDARAGAWRLLCHAPCNAGLTEAIFRHSFAQAYQPGGPNGAGCSGGGSSSSTGGDPWPEINVRPWDAGLVQMGSILALSSTLSHRQQTPAYTRLAWQQPHDGDAHGSSHAPPPRPTSPTAAAAVPPGGPPEDLVGLQGMWKGTYGCHGVELIQVGLQQLDAPLDDDSQPMPPPAASPPPGHHHHHHHPLRDRSQGLPPDNVHQQQHHQQPVPAGAQAQAACSRASSSSAGAGGGGGSSSSSCRSAGASSWAAPVLGRLEGPGGWPGGPWDAMPPSAPQPSRAPHVPLALLPGGDPRHAAHPCHAPRPQQQQQQQQLFAGPSAASSSSTPGLAPLELPLGSPDQRLLQLALQSDEEEEEEEEEGGSSEGGGSSSSSALDGDHHAVLYDPSSDGEGWEGEAWQGPDAAPPPAAAALPRPAAPLAAAAAAGGARQQGAAPAARSSTWGPLLTASCPGVLLGGRGACGGAPPAARTQAALPWLPMSGGAAAADDDDGVVLLLGRAHGGAAPRHDAAAAPCQDHGPTAAAAAAAAGGGGEAGVAQPGLWLAHDPSAAAPSRTSPHHHHHHQQQQEGVAAAAPPPTGAAWGGVLPPGGCGGGGHHWYAVGTKVTGDLNVPAGKVSFVVDGSSRCTEHAGKALALPPGYDTDVALFKPGVRQVVERARYQCRAQLALHGFRRPSIIGAELLLFDQRDCFGLLWHGQVQSLSLFVRVSRP